MNLTDEEIRIKVAEACGWLQREATLDNPVEKGGMRLPNYFHQGSQTAWTHEKQPGVYTQPPNYPEDLNAIHEAIMSLPINKRDQFDVELAVVVHGDFIRHQVRYQRFETTNATARQRCLAYLKTKGILP